MTEQEILDALRDAGHRLTAPRRTLVRLLLAAEAPLTAEEAYRRARQAGVRANLSTIYRNLATFCEMGWLSALPGPNGERYFQAQPDGQREQAMAVMCLDCGQMTTLKGGVADPLSQAVRAMGFDVQTLRVTMAARCEHVCPNKKG